MNGSANAQPSVSGRSDGRFGAQVLLRKANYQAVIENSLAHLTDEELQRDVRAFTSRHLPEVSANEVLRAARVAKDIRMYHAIAQEQPIGPQAPPGDTAVEGRQTADSYLAAAAAAGPKTDQDHIGVGVGIGNEIGRVDTRSHSTLAGTIRVTLSDRERWALKREFERPYSERGTIRTILTVSMAAFLQGFVQSSINGTSLYGQVFGVNTTRDATSADDWRLGAANASPYFFAALLGCPLALPANYYLGRRGAIAVAACAVLASSLGAAWCRTWVALLGVRIINGVGMGIKAVSTPILASETAVEFWRGSSLLAWQLWVACGIMMGFAFNLIFTNAKDDTTAFMLTQVAPVVPALALLVAVYYCPESPRYLLRPPRSRPQEALEVLLKLRNTRLQALRDLYSIHKSVEQEEYNSDSPQDGTASPAPTRGTEPWWTSLYGFVLQYRDLFRERRLRNALISSSTVAIAQQLCGINVLAFYSNTLFSRAGAAKISAMKYSLGYGAVNFAFALPAIKSIDVLGRRMWLLMTLPPMALLMGAAAASFHVRDEEVRLGTVALWLFLFAVVYSPGLGPVPFTLAAESFPLSHRELGTAFAIATNLLFAGLLTLFYPKIHSALTDKGALGLFSGFNGLAFVLVFLLVEETAKRGLEDLDLVFAVPKSRFVRFQVKTTLPWFVRRFILRRRDAVGTQPPSLYLDKIWGDPVGVGDGLRGDVSRDELEEVEMEDQRTSGASEV